MGIGGANVYSKQTVHRFRPKPIDIVLNLVYDLA